VAKANCAPEDIPVPDFGRGGKDSTMMPEIFSWVRSFSKASMRRPRKTAVMTSVPAEVELLDTRALLSAAHVATVTTPAAPNHAVDTLLTGESNLIAFEDGLIKAEAKAVSALGSKIPASVATEAIALDNAILKIDADLVGQSTGAAGGVDGAIIANYSKFAKAAKSEATKLQAEMTALTKVEAALTTIANGGGAGSLTSGQQKLLKEAVKLEQTAANKLSANYTKLEPAFKGTNLESSTTQLGTDIAALAALKL
jgi:hypothetical protein